MKRKRDFITLIIIFLFIIMIYGWYAIKIPFDLSDMSLNFITYGNYQFDSLPQTLKNINIPLGFIEQMNYMIKSTGRLIFAYAQIFGLYTIFGHELILWRLYRFIIVLLLLFFANKFLDKLKIAKYYRAAIIGFLLLNSPTYHFFDMACGYAITELFFMIAFVLVIFNCSSTNSKFKFALIGSIFVFLSALFRELTLVMFPALFFLILFWNKTSTGDIELKFKWNWKRILPYCFAVLLFVFLYVLFTFLIGRDKTAYSNMVSFSLNLKIIIARLAYYFGIGISTKYYFGSILFLTILTISFLVGYKMKATLSKISVYILLFSFIMIIVHTLIFSLIQQPTGGDFFPILGCLIVYAVLIDFIINNIPQDIKKLTKLLTIIAVSLIWIIQLLETLQKIENSRAQNIAYQQTVKYINKIAPKSANIALSGFDIAPAYSFVAYVFMEGRTDNLKYSLFMENVDSDNITYTEHLKYLFNSYDPKKEQTDLIIFSNAVIIPTEGCDFKIKKVISEKVYRFSLLNLIKNTKEENIKYIITQNQNSTKTIFIKD